MRFLSWRFLMLLIGYFVFSLVGIFLKSSTGYPVLSSGFILRFAGALLCVFCFAILWQQVLSEYELMTAYAWRGILFLWTFLWAVLFFGESVMFNNIIGAAVILYGVFLVSRSE